MALEARISSSKKLTSNVEPETWGPVLKEGVEKQELGVVPYKLELDYNHWSYRTPSIPGPFAQPNVLLKDKQMKS